MKNKYIRNAHLNERVFRRIVKCFSVDLPALKASEFLGIRRQTVQRVYALLRGRVVELAVEEAQQFGGEVEVDESYFGPRRVRGKRGRAAGRKIPVIGLHKRGDRVFVSIVKNCSRRELMPVIQGNVLQPSLIYTDAWTAYDGLVTDGYRHHRVHHHENEFVRGKNHVNGIESFWSFAKLRLATLRGVRRDFFLLHLKECEWRWNHRRDNIYKILLHFLRSFPL